MKYLLLYFILAFCFNVAHAQDIPKKFVGIWRAKCGRSGSINISENSSVAIEVNSNQIYVSAKAIVDKDDASKLLIYLVEPEDLGAGGMKLGWKSYSKTKPIATIQSLPTQKGKIFLFWDGFYNTKTKKYEWIEKPDWNDVEGYNTTMYRCKD